MYQYSEPSPTWRRRCRRHSLPDTSDLSSPFSTSRSRRLSRSEEARTSSTGSRAHTDKDIQKSKRVNRKQITFDIKSDQTNPHYRTSDAPTPEQVQVLRETVICEVHQTQSSHKQATNGVLRNKTRSCESVSHPREDAEPSRRANVRPINYELIAAGTPVVDPNYTPQYEGTFKKVHINPGRSNVYTYYEPYRHEVTPPPSPAPPDIDKSTRVPKGHLYTNVIPLPAEPSLPPAPRSILRKPSIDRVQYTTDKETGDSLERPILRKLPYVELPRVDPTDSPRRRRQSYSEPSYDSHERNRLSYIDQPVSRSYLEPTEYERCVRGDYRASQIDPLPLEDRFGDRSLPALRRHSNLSARKFLDLSPHFDEDFTIPIHQLPQEYFLRPVEERFFEPYPHQVQVEPHERPILSPTSRSWQSRSQRTPRLLPSTYRRSRTRERVTTQSFYANHNRDFMDMMNSLDEHDRKIIIEFCHLLEKSKQLFNGLRELPHYGHKQWHAYFGRTFDVYTKLWKFQQQHRVILDSKYGLKRWQIGEIASKIGQLYYHFYLRTSETAYLNEAHSFYSAIRGRSYYTQASREDKCELMVKKLRYYARYIVVCLLLNKIKLVIELLKELDKQIIEYGATYSPDDQLEWTVVADEVRAFIKALSVVSVFHPDSFPVVLSHRMNPQTTPPVDRNHFMTLALQELLVVGSNLSQVKFSELTMDMFRIIQTLEREPSGDIQHMYDESPRQRYPSTPSAANSKGYNLECAPNRAENPHKYLLYKPSPSQIFVYLASACSDLPPNGALLLYLSADGLLVPPSKHQSEDAGGYESGGLITSSKSEVAYKETTKDGKSVPPKHKDLQVLHPGDLYPFTRRPMFLIVDADNSYIFQNMPRYFGQPLVILMSPVEEPASLHASVTDKRQNGSLFTLFLHCPLSALCYCCDIPNMSLGNWERAQSYIDNYLAEASQMFTRNRTDMMFMAFMGDDFFRLLILRYIFCETVLRMHRAFRSRNHLTRSSPTLPDDLFEHPVLTRIVMDLASHLQVRGHFHDPSAAAPPPPQNKE